MRSLVSALAVMLLSSGTGNAHVFLCLTEQSLVEGTEQFIKGGEDQLQTWLHTSDVCIRFDAHPDLPFDVKTDFVQTFETQGLRYGYVPIKLGSFKIYLGVSVLKLMSDVRI